MKLIKVVSKTQAMYYRLADNRIGVIYPNTGYIRVSPGWVNDPDYTRNMQPYDLQCKINNTKNLVLYQINPKKKITSPNGNYTHVRILFEDIWKMQQYLEEYEIKNCIKQTA